MKKDKDKGKNYYPIYNKKGKASYYVDHDKIHIYDWAGNPLCFVEKGAIFNFNALLLGWLDEGWVRDREGKCVGFVESGPGGPNPPRTKTPTSPPAEKKEPPEKPAVEPLTERAPRRPVWSALSDAELFSPRKR